MNEFAMPAENLAWFAAHPTEADAILRANPSWVTKETARFLVPRCSSCGDPVRVTHTNPGVYYQLRDEGRVCTRCTEASA